MVDTTGAGLGGPAANSMAAFSPQLNQLTQSLDLLYIKNNAGGRRIFRDKWPEVAEYIFGDQLTAYDRQGVENDEHRKHRGELEDEADMRRIDLKQTIGVFIEKSVDAGSLQFEYVGEVIDKYGALVSQFLYEESILERVRPGVLDASKTAYEEAQEKAKASQEQAETEQKELQKQEAKKYVTEALIEAETEAQQESSAVPSEDGVAENVTEVEQPAAVEESQVAPIPEPEVVQEMPQENVSHEDGSVEQGGEVEQSQDIEGTQQNLEPSPMEDQPQQHEVEGVSEALTTQQPKEFVEPAELNHVQPQEGGENTEDDRLSAEEVEILSNKVEEEAAVPVPEAEAIQEAPVDEAVSDVQNVPEQLEPESQSTEEPFFEEEHLPPVPEEDPLENVKPIETSMPEMTELPEEQDINEKAVSDSIPEQPAKLTAEVLTEVVQDAPIMPETQTETIVDPEVTAEPMDMTSGDR